MLVEECSVALLQVGAVAQDDRRRLRWPWWRYRSAESVARTSRGQITGVVEVGVGDDDGVDALRLDGQRLPVEFAEVLHAWNSPQSTRIRLPPDSRRCFEPVTVPAAPRLQSRRCCRSTDSCAECSTHQRGQDDIHGRQSHRLPDEATGSGRSVDATAIAAVGNGRMARTCTTIRLRPAAAPPTASTVAPEGHSKRDRI